MSDAQSTPSVESIGRWSHNGVHRRHYSAILTRIQIALYRGQADGAWRRLSDLELILRQTYLRHQEPACTNQYQLKTTIERNARKGHKENQLDLVLCGLRGLCVPRASVPFHRVLALGRRPAEFQIQMVALRLYRRPASRFEPSVSHLGLVHLEIGKGGQEIKTEYRIPH